MIKEYKINKHNSTVCGYPGRDFDWSKFGWNGGEVNHLPGMKEPFVSIGAWVDDGFIGSGNAYLHVPYDFAENGTIYRVRPNESMRAGHKYRGMTVVSCVPVKKDDGWYWQLQGN